MAAVRAAAAARDNAEAEQALEKFKKHLNSTHDEGVRARRLASTGDPFQAPARRSSRRAWTFGPLWGCKSNTRSTQGLLFFVR